MLSTDLISELRSEVTRWWEALHHQYQLRQQQQEQEAASMQAQQQQAQGSVLTPILGAMLGDGPIRMITLGQELTADLDEKTLAEMQFKDLQVRESGRDCEFMIERFCFWISYHKPYWWRYDKLLTF